MTSLPTTHRPSDSFSPRAGVHAHVLGVKLSSTGPFLFKQERVGYGEKPFKIYKIRTTVIGPEAQGVGVIICLGLVALPLWVAAIYRLGAALLCSYGLSQSFLFRLDQFGMLAFLWCLLLIGSHDRNQIDSETDALMEE